MDPTIFIMRSFEVLTESKLSVPGLKDWLETANLEHGTDDVQEVIQDHYHGNALKYVMAGNAFKNSMGDPLTVYRGLHIDDPQLWVKNLVRGVGRDLGVSWTHDFHAAINENGPDGGFGRAMEGPTNVVLVATVAHDAVDWYSTWAINSIDGDEPEIRLFRKAQVYLDEALLLNFSNHDWMNKVGRNHVTRTVPLNLRLKA